MLQDFLEKLGLNQKEQKIFLTLAELGAQPASIVAKHCNFDRVTTYKNLQRLAEKNFVKIYYENGIQYFGSQSYEHLESNLKEKAALYTDLLAQFETVMSLFKSLKAQQSFVPKLEIFEGDSGIKNFFRDLIFEIKEDKLRQIRMMTTNTFDERLGDIHLSKFVKDFFKELRTKKIDCEIFEISGTLIPEHLRKIPFNEFDPEKFPATRGVTNIFLAGHAVYLASYKATPIGLKMKHPEMSQIFHFLFDLAGKQQD